jgi:glutamine synthetase type III
MVIIFAHIDSVEAISMDIEIELSEAQGYVKALEVEAKSVITGDKRDMVAKVSSYTGELKSSQENYRKARFEAEMKCSRNGAGDRERLVKNNDRLDNSTRTLENSRMIAAQTSQIGNVIMSDMESQREQLEDAHSRVQDTHKYTMDAKGVLKMIYTRAVVHKVCVYFTIALLFSLIIIVIYYGFIKGK